MWVNQLQDQRVVFKQGPTGSVWALERSVKDRLNKGHRPAKPAGTDPTTGFQVSPTQWHAWSSTSTVTWPTLVCLLALQPGRGQLANLLFGKSMVVTCSSTWLGDPPFIFACRLGGVDKFLRYSGTSWDDRVQTYCQGTVLGGLTMDLWSLSHYVLLPVPVLFIPLGVRVNASLSLFSVVKPFPFRSFGFSLNFLDRLGLREELLTKLAESTVIPMSFVSKLDVENFISAGMECGISSHVLVEKERWIHTVAARQQKT